VLVRVGLSFCSKVWTSASSDLDELDLLAERPSAGQEHNVVCQVYEEGFDKLPTFIDTAVLEGDQDGRPTCAQTK
jgi:hypothetical protein